MPHQVKSLYINDPIPSNVRCQMYADDAVIYVHAKNKDQAAQEQTGCTNPSLSSVFQNLSFSKKTAASAVEPDVMVRGTKIKTVHEFKYLGVIVDSEKLH